MAVRHSGRLKKWNDDRGFGFIDVGRDREVFVHIKDFRKNCGRPEEGQELTFEIGLDSQKRRRALQVEITSGRTAAQRKKLTEARRPSYQRLLLLPLVGAGAVILGGGKPLFWPAAGVYLGSSMMSLLLYGVDKFVAGTEKTRVPEVVLHFFDLIGGWPGGLVAQALFRHKTRKESFQIVFWATVIFNVAALAFVLFIR